MSKYNDELAYFRKQVEILRVMCPVKHKVDVRRCKMPEDDKGDASYNKKKRRFTVRVNNTLPIEFQIWVLLHEWAHCMTWGVTHTLHDDHGAHFGIAYSEAYRAIYGASYS